MHLKNMALLKIAEHGEMQFRSVRMAPLYDAVTTRVFPNLKHDRMALKLNGKDDNCGVRIFARWRQPPGFGSATLTPRWPTR